MSRLQKPPPNLFTGVTVGAGGLTSGTPGGCRTACCAAVTTTVAGWMTTSSVRITNSTSASAEVGLEVAMPTSWGSASAGLGWSGTTPS